MTQWATEAAASGERIPVVGDRVTCPRIGPVNVDRCPECIYLIRLEVRAPATPRYVVCSVAYLEAETEFGW
jgi:hypothetical protein